MQSQKSQYFYDTAGKVSKARTDVAAGGDSGLFLLVAALFLAALLISLPETAIDIFIIFGFLLAGAAFIIALLARKFSDIKGFCLLMSLITLLRLAVNVSVSRAILLTGSGGRLVNWCGMTIHNGFVSIVIYSALAIIAFTFIFGSWRSVFCRAAEHLKQILPFEKTNIEIGRRAKFFRSMIIVAKLSVCEAIIVLVTACVTLTGTSALRIFNFVGGGDIVNADGPVGAIGASCFTLVPAILMASASLILINKAFLIVQSTQEPEMNEPKAVAVYVESREISSGIDSVQPTVQNNIDTIISEVMDSSSTVVSIAASDTDFVTQNSKEASFENSSIEQETVESSEDYYDRITSALRDTNASIILLAGEKISKLPVTAAVNVAIRFAQTQKRCLLIDTDASRNAVSQAFEVNSNLSRGKAVKSCIENLWICPADDLDNTSSNDLKKKILKAGRIFEQIVIYSPNATSAYLRNAFDGMVEAAVFFGRSPSLNSLADSLEDWGCRVTFETDLLKQNAIANTV
jgi:hypothetical protein